MIRQYLRDLIDEHKPIMELNNINNININNNNNNNNNSINNNNNNNNRAEWKIQLIIKKKLFLLKILKILALYIQQVNQLKFL